VKSVGWVLGVAAFVSAGLVAGGQTPAQTTDDMLRAMQTELQRSRSLQAGDTGAPYYVEYALDDVESYQAVASMGGTLVSDHARARVPRVDVRVGDYTFDNTNYPGAGGRGGISSLPIDGDATTIRRGFWILTDALYKNAVEALTRKKTALMNVTQQDTLNDFARAQPTTTILPLRKMEFKDDQWRQTAVTVSSVFKDYPMIVGSLVTVQANYSNSYFVNSEGSSYRFADDLLTFRVTATAQAKDGMPVSEATSVVARTPGGWIAEAEMRRIATEVAKDVAALVDAPMAESYSGPVLIEGDASPQLLAQLIGPNLSLARRIAGGAGRAGGRGGAGGSATTGEWEGRVGSRVLPDWMDLVDDATRESYKGRELLGYYPIDMEAVVPKPITLVERGLLKNYLMTRQPVTGYEGSNGHARLPGANGAKLAAFSNLFVQAHDTVTEAALKTRFLDMLKQRGKPYGIIVRKIDFPQSGSSTGIRLRAGATAVAPPLMAYKVYPDGREELVRGLSFASINLRGLRDITAASDQEHIFEYIAQSGSYITGQSVIAPSILFEDMDLDRREADWPKPPIVPPPGR